MASGGRIYKGSFAFCCDATTLFKDDDVLPEGGTNAEVEPTRQETTTTVIAAAMLIKDDTPTNLMVPVLGLIWFD